jgi:papain like protease/uncharacterized protein DUF4384
MNQEVTLYLWQDKITKLKRNLGRIVLILPFFYFSNTAFSQTNPTGVIISDFEYHKVEKRYFSVRGGTRVIPKSYSLKEFAPKPMNQFDYPTSPAWATSYAALTILEAQQLGRKGKAITENAFSPLFPYFFSSENTKSNSCDQPVSIGQVLSAMKSYGTPRYTDFPVRCVTHSPENNKTKAAKNRISEYARIFDVNDSKTKKIRAIKTTLSENLPVVIAMHYGNSFNYAKDFWQPRESFNANLPAKALCVVGYDDEKFGGSFEVMNSQGTEWGNDGFLWIPYEDFILFTRQAYSLYMIPSKNGDTELSGGIELEIVNGENMELIQLKSGYYKIKNSYPSGTQFKIKIINHSTGFLYVFASDLTEEIFELFPPALTSAAFSREASFYVPDENTPIEIDETIGTDYLCVLFSKEDLDIAAIYNTIKKVSGNFETKVSTALADKLVPINQVKFKTSAADFSVDESSKSVVFLIIEHEHN